jgi:hypothetical protein
VAIADLSRVCAIQRHVLTDDATQRVADVDGLDLTSIAAVAIPLAQPRRLAAAFNSEKQSWIFSSANPNLRIAGQCHGEVQPGVHAFGFVISVSASFIQVARYRDRYLRRDGYHRAYGFLARGIQRVPVFVRDYETFAEMGLPSGLSPQDTYLGERPPLVADYLDDAVSAASVIAGHTEVVVVQGLEVATLGQIVRAGGRSHRPPGSHHSGKAKTRRARNRQDYCGPFAGHSVPEWTFKHRTISSALANLFGKSTSDRVWSGTRAIFSPVRLSVPKPRRPMPSVGLADCTARA